MRVVHEVGPRKEIEQLAGALVSACLQVRVRRDCELKGLVHWCAQYRRGNGGGHVTDDQSQPPGKASAALGQQKACRRSLARPREDPHPRHGQHVPHHVKASARPYWHPRFREGHLVTGPGLFLVEVMRHLTVDALGAVSENGLHEARQDHSHGLTAQRVIQKVIKRPDDAELRDARQGRRQRTRPTAGEAALYVAAVKRAGGAVCVMAREREGVPERSGYENAEWPAEEAREHQRRIWELQLHPGRSVPLLAPPAAASGPHVSSSPPHGAKLPYQA
eukprot:CAMPEP_0117575896 /NCGR_PEP_ID=MMETSP0784-20121206/62481_1 /TAXON_ID=39447 /ORGANISM="" /LENGTH=276 /DNA_ID=CAMNT_0005375057 /DNA_START=170 /DNA_END=996 /DNA_ORIENTATION=+